MNISIKNKFRVGVLTVFLMVLVLGGVALYTQNRLNRQLLALSHEAANLNQVSELRLAAYKAIMPGNDYIITGKSNYRQEFEAQDKVVEAHFAAILASTHFSARDREVITKVYPLYTATKETTLKIFAQDHRDPGLPLLMEEMDYQYAEPLLTKLNELTLRTKAAYTRIENEAGSLKRFSERVMIITVLGISLMLILGGIFLLNSILKPLQSVGAMLDNIASGQGDLTKRLPQFSQDEIGSLCGAFNQFVSNLQQTVTDISTVSGRLSSTAGSVSGTSEQIRNTVTQQVDSVNETLTATGRLDEAIKSIASDTKSVLDALMGVSSSSQKISATMNEIATSTRHLDERADLSLSAISENVASFKDVAANISTVTSRAEEVASSALQISVVAKEISSRSQDQAEVARSVKEDAISLGLEAINKTKDGMVRIRAEVSATMDVMNELGRMSREISRIVKIINTISDQSNLLALNASVIAAQAGDHGKGFGIVANEVKQLAQQAKDSTNVISDMVQSIQQLTTSALAANKRSAEEVDIGVLLSAEAEKALTTIIARTEQSLENARQIARSAEEQTLGINMVSGAMQDVSTMAIQINQTTEQQRLTSESMLASTKEMRGLIESMKRMVSAQADESGRISRAIIQTLESLQLVAQATVNQQEASDTIVEVMENVNRQAGINMLLAKNLDESVCELNDQSRDLNTKVNVFTV